MAVTKPRLQVAHPSLELGYASNWVTKPGHKRRLTGREFIGCTFKLVHVAFLHPNGMEDIREKSYRCRTCPDCACSPGHILHICVHSFTWVADYDVMKMLASWKLRSIGFVTKLEPQLPLNNSIVAWRVDDPNGEILVFEPLSVTMGGSALRPWQKEKCRSMRFR